MYIVDPSVGHREAVPNVLQCEENISGTQCHSKVTEVDGICGECTSCMSMVKLSKCLKKLVKIEDEDSEWHVVTMFNSTLEKVIDASGGSPSVVKRLLLDLPKMVSKVNVKDVVTEAVRHNGTWREDPADTPPLQ